MVHPKRSLAIIFVGIVFVGCRRDEDMVDPIVFPDIPELPTFEIPDTTPPLDMDAGTPEVVEQMTLRVVNLSDQPVNACWQQTKPLGTGPMHGPLFRAEGIPPMSESERVVVDRVRMRVVFVAVGASCETPTEIRVVAPSADQAHIDVWFKPEVKALQANASVFDDDVTPVPGKDTIRFVGHDALSAHLSFMPEGGTTAMPGPKLELEGGALGSLVVSAGRDEIERPIRAKAGGTLSVFLTGNQLALCDDSAEIVDGVASCGPEVRQP